MRGAEETDHRDFVALVWFPAGDRVRVDGPSASPESLVAAVPAGRLRAVPHTFVRLGPFLFPVFAVVSAGRSGRAGQIEVPPRSSPS